ncbi:uncharacterized protein LOC129599669 [Paramacrobiotus metropolitanus]|uniref:uncharacterized protein LOC129599669 n=1 Tax=Paramacrobiotus metropolitanus TaxID=2943436 RepID=UPI002445780C|nr:uncharacterized protein LOC129599669 [Paramacrobiotus metropolitanus]
MSAKKHVLFLSFPAFGHIIPLLEFARKVAKHHTVTFAVSRSKMEEMIKKELFGDESAENIKLLPIDDEPIAFGETDNPIDDQKAFALIFESVLPAVKNLLLKVPLPDGTGDRNAVNCEPVDVIISEIFLAEPLQICRERAIPFYIFNTSALWLIRYFDLITDESTIVPFDKMDPFHIIPEPGDPPVEVSMPFAMLFGPIRKIFPYTLGMIHNSCETVDKADLQLLQQHPVTKHFPHFLVGPLVPQTSGKVSGENLVLTKKVHDWLSGKEQRSVVYITFGSVAIPADEQITELAQALLKLNKPFIWSLRDRKHHCLPEKIRSKIAAQLDNDGGQFLILPWAPQKVILAHPATAVIISHCGWNSLLETVSNGIPVVSWPMFADQLINGRWLVQAGMAELVEGTGSQPKRIVPADEIADTIAKVAGFNDASNAGNRYGNAATRWKNEMDAALAPGGTSANDFAKLCQFDEIA